MSWQLKSDEVVQATGAKSPAVSAVFTGISTDSRVDVKGKLFVALKGDQFDGHDYVVKAIAGGAAGAIIHQDRSEFAALKSKAAFFQVGDTLKALQDLGQFWRRKHDFFVLAISGSNGKTSSKEYALELLKDFKPTFASQGSFNNHWGVPISILGAGPEHKLLILEMGMNHMGELRRLAQIAEPDVTVITMVGPSHIGELGSQENIAKAKEELYEAAPQSTAIYNLDNQWTAAMYVHAVTGGTHRRLITFSSHKPNCDVSFRAERMTMEGLEIDGAIGGTKNKCYVKIFGRQNLNNLMVAAGLGLAAGMHPEEIWKRLPSIATAAWGRNQWLKLPSGANVLFDAYNANPVSMTAMIKNIYELETPGKKFLILGEMLELGTESEKSHRDLGDLAGKIGAETIWFIGPHSKDVEDGVRRSGFTGRLFLSNDFDAAISSSIKSSLGPNDIVGLKASRGQKLERVLENWGLDV